MEVGVRELKQQLSRYLDRVEAGAELIVTDRGKPKARLVPLVEHGLLQRGIDEGWIRGPLRSHRIGESARFSSAKRTLDILDEDRNG